MRILLVLALFAAVPALAQNTGTLAGHVTDSESGEPLVGANVFLAEIQRGAATDIDGNYVILGIPVGTHTVQLSYAGMTAQTIEAVEVGAGETRVLNAQLEASADAINWTCYYEPPYFSRDIYSPRWITGANIQHLPTTR